MKFLLLTTLLLYPLSSQAQTTCATNEACVNWTAATTFVDGTPLPATGVTYNVYSQVVNTPPVLRTTVAASSVVLKGLPLGDHCFWVRTVVNGVESDNSNIACKTLRMPAPTDGSIAPPTDGSIVYSQ